ncbi:uncharacterized protein LOC126655301 [Mercurialis annua]|uniref:uncharacterized protein LOC126655301 n=1 Tax=Mercurialis annua TaxID=3986 RepID=UPI002160B264|nr:uncharacterized protein LOC126655301 [Mercurialis annua]
MAEQQNEVVSQTFRALTESADRKFARVRDLQSYGRKATNHHYFHKVFKAYMRLWKYQQENRAKLVDSGLNRWEIGEIASRIGQLYFNQYMRTSEARFLVEAYVFYEAILNRRYFGESGGKMKGKDVGVRFKELRFYARFLLVALILNKFDMVHLLVDKFRALVDDCKSNFKETNFKEWKLVLQEITRFMEVDNVFENARPLRYSVLFDVHPTSHPFVARFHARKILKFKDAILTSYHRNEVKFAELTLDNYRMMQCLEWEPSGSFYQKRPIELVYQKRPDESYANGSAADHSEASGLIDINLAADLTDPSLPPNPRKAVLYRPSATHLLAVLATICEELPPESVMLIYLSASGNSCQSYISQTDSSGGSRKSSKNKVVSGTSSEQNSSASDIHSNGKRDSNDYHDNYLWLGPRGTGGSNALYPGDLIPFTRKPLFLIIDSDSSHAFKMLHGAERGEPIALLLSPLKPAFKNLSGVDRMHSGSQFTFFLAAPLQAFCQMVGLTSADTDADDYTYAEGILANVFAEWEVILCRLTNLDLVWAQVLSDPFLRRLILRFVFCRSVLSLFCKSKDSEQYLPVCLPHLPNSVSPSAQVVQSAVIRLANHLKVADFFHFDDS